MKGKCSYYETDANNPGADLDEDKFKEIVADYIKKKGNIPSNEADPSKFIK
jgi:major membrane immunogen (membrane-anchored lipoprotein)